MNGTNPDHVTGSPKTPIVQNPMMPTRAQEQVTLDEGPVVLQWPNSLSPDSVEEFEDWINVLLKRLKRKAGTTKP